MNRRMTNVEPQNVEARYSANYIIRQSEAIPHLDILNSSFAIKQFAPAPALQCMLDGEADFFEGIGLFDVWSGA